MSLACTVLRIDGLALEIRVTSIIPFSSVSNRVLGHETFYKYLAEQMCDELADCVSSLITCLRHSNRSIRAFSAFSSDCFALALLLFTGFVPKKHFQHT